MSRHNTSADTTRLQRGCDRCGATAKYEAVTPSGSVLRFCGHHHNQHEAALTELGCTVLELASRGFATSKLF